MDIVSRLIYCDFQEENGKDTRILRKIIRKRSKSCLVKLISENGNGYEYRDGYGSGYGNWNGNGNGYGDGNGLGGENGYGDGSGESACNE